MVEITKPKRVRKPRNPKASVKDPVVEPDPDPVPEPDPVPPPAPVPEPQPEPDPEPGPINTEETPVSVPSTPPTDPAPVEEGQDIDPAPTHPPATAPDDPEDAINDPLLTVPRSQPRPGEPDHYNPGPDIVVAESYDDIVETNPADAEYPRAEATLGAKQPVPRKGPKKPEPELQVPEGHVKVKCTSKRGVFHSGGPLEHGDIAAVSAEDADLLVGLGVVERV